MTTKYQLIVNADTAEEIANVSAILAKAMGATALPTQNTSSPVVQTPQAVTSAFPGSTNVEDEDDEPQQLTPAQVFAAPLDPAQVFAPNAQSAATAQPSPTVAPVVTAASTTAGGVELDPRGFPWDARIHSGNKTRMKENNNWKYARGVSQELKDQVENELRAQGYGVPQVGATLPSQREEVPALLQAPSSAGATIQSPNQLAPAAPALPGMPPAPAPKLKGPDADTITERLTKGIQAGLVDASWVLQVLNYFGMRDMQDIANHPGKFVEMTAYLDNLRASQPGFENF